MEYGRDHALLVVDVQNDFADPNGSLFVAGAQEAIVAINVEIGRAVEAGAPVAYTQDWHPASTPHFAKDGGIWPVHCVADTWGAAFHPALTVLDEAIFIRKGSRGEDGYSGFTVRDPESGIESSTGLEAALRAAGVTALTIVGLATDYCVMSSALDAMSAGFATTVLADAIRAVNLAPGDGVRAGAAMASAGVSVR